MPQILRAFGHRRCMHLVFLAFLLRMGWYAALERAPSPWLVLPAEVRRPPARCSGERSVFLRAPCGAAQCMPIPCAS